MSYIKNIFIISAIVFSAAASDHTYTLAVCTTSDYEGAIHFKEKYLTNPKADIFIIKNVHGTYKTTYGAFNSYDEIRNFQKTLPQLLKKQNPFIRELEYDLTRTDNPDIEKFSYQKTIIKEAPVKLLPLQKKIEDSIPVVMADENITTTANYTISVCSVKEYKNALICATQYIPNPKTDIFIIKDTDGMYKTMYGTFDFYKEAKKFSASMSKVTKAQTPYIKKINFDLKNSKNVIETILFDKKNISSLSLDQNSSIQQVKEITGINKNILSVLQPETTVEINSTTSEIAPITVPKVIALIETNESVVLVSIQKYAAKIVLKNPMKILDTPITVLPAVYFNNKSHQVDLNKNLIGFSDITKYQQLLISVDSKSNQMFVKGLLNGNYCTLKEYKVSTGRKDIKLPQGMGGITAISFNPIWYPTTKTIKYFRESKNVKLPSAIPSGDKYNYMGSAKINLTHIVNGSNVYRIHGTLNDNTIGRNESGGCIRMKNNEVYELAKLLTKFVTIKNMQNVKVILN